ncbi:unnamed protein product [Prorocentrum cordatum]|uniref:Uncharacterized protein n=1 Tax=Prorocentrum cordatum TaxID=2364126 RepID=A0ABN9TLY4_9DINO|nr:unnamed protein product [Polarella glacialis]
MHCNALQQIDETVLPDTRTKLQGPRTALALAPAKAEFAVGGIRQHVDDLQQSEVELETRFQASAKAANDQQERFKQAEADQANEEEAAKDAWTATAPIDSIKFCTMTARDKLQAAKAKFAGSADAVDEPRRVSSAEQFDAARKRRTDHFDSVAKRAAELAQILSGPWMEVWFHIASSWQLGPLAADATPTAAVSASPATLVWTASSTGDEAGVLREREVCSVATGVGLGVVLGLAKVLHGLDLLLVLRVLRHYTDPWTDEFLAELEICLAADADADDSSEYEHVTVEHVTVDDLQKTAEDIEGAIPSPATVLPVVKGMLLEAVPIVVGPPAR